MRINHQHYRGALAECFNLHQLLATIDFVTIGSTTPFKVHSFKFHLIDRFTPDHLLIINYFLTLEI